jgi:transcriptional regulator with XRE-family HTH domain
MRKVAQIRRVLAKNLRRLRHAKGLSQDALAADADQHQALISEIENARANVELDTLGKIAAALGVHPRELFEE